MGCNIYAFRNTVQQIYVRDSYSFFGTHLSHYGMSWQEIGSRLGSQKKRIYKGKVLRSTKLEKEHMWLSPKNVHWFYHKLITATYQEGLAPCWENEAIFFLFTIILLNK